MFEDTGWYAITDLELRQLHFAVLIAGGADVVGPFIEKIRSRAIDYRTEEIVGKLVFETTESTNT